jgi:hypothetical protein
MSLSLRDFEQLASAAWIGSRFTNRPIRDGENPMNVHSQDFWLFVFQMLQALGQAGSVVVAFYAVWLVQRYTRQKDGADFLRNRWNEQAQLNIACIQSDEVLKAHEEIVYGRTPSDLRTSRRYFVMFSMLNQIQHLFIAYEHNVLDRDEFERAAIQTVKLLKREQTTVAYLLAERGYSQRFANAIIPLFAKVVAPDLL